MKKFFCGTYDKKRLRLIAGIMAALTPLGFVIFKDKTNDKSGGFKDSVSYTDLQITDYKKNKNDNNYNESDSETITSNNINNFNNDESISNNTDIASNYNQNNLNYVSNYDVNEVIKNILNVKYECSDNVFNIYSIDIQVKEAKEELNTGKYTHKKNNNFDNASYMWLNNQTIDFNLLENKLIYNCEKNNVKITDNIKKIAQMIPNIISTNIDYMRKKYPNYDFSVLYHNLDELYLKSGEDETNGYYNYTSNYILISDHTLNESYDNIRFVISHELFHLIFKKCYVEEKIYNSGTSVVVNDNDILTQNFIEEYVATKFAFNSIGKDIDPVFSYNNCEELINLLSKYTNVQADDIIDFWVTSDFDSFSNLFVDEMKGFDYIFKTLAALSKSADLSSIPIDCNHEEYKKNCYSYAILNMYKNVCISGIKSIEKGSLTIDKLKLQLDSFLKDAYSVNYSNCNKTDLEKKLAQINNVLNSYQKIKSYNK